MQEVQVTLNWEVTLNVGTFSKSSQPKGYTKGKESFLKQQGKKFSPNTTDPISDLYQKNE